jgi:signal transduction histidine kinase/ligand-binding sensor domain-containing protein/DNA-binding response OmpR family regulator
MLHKYFLIIILTIVSQQLFSTEHHPYQTIGIEKGLSNNSVRYIFKDSKGLMWFGTHDGLNRYDGYEFKIYRNILDDTSSLPHNYIYTINEDVKHNLWIGTGQGIGILTPLSNKFSPFYFIRKEDGVRIRLKAQINKITNAPNGDVLVATNGAGLIVKGLNRKDGLRCPVLPIKGAPIYDYNITDIKLDSRKNIYVFIEQIGLCIYNSKNKHINPVNNSLLYAYCIEPDEKDNILLSSAAGLFRFDVNSRLTTRIDKGASAPVNSRLIIRMYMDRQKNLWLGTIADGLKYKRYGSDDIVVKQLERGVQNQSVTAIFEDEAGVKWIGTSKNGIYVFDPRPRKFKTFAHDPANENSLVNNFVSAFYEHRDGRIWVGTDAGISIWNRGQKSFATLNGLYPVVNPLNNSSISAIRPDYVGNIWIATYGNGIYQYNELTGVFKNYRCFNPYTQSENENVRQLVEGHDQILWATTFSQGTLYFFNRAKDRFEPFDKNLQENLLALQEDRQHVLWGGNAAALIKIDRLKQNHQYVNVGKPVRVLHEDKQGNFWIGSEGGGLLLFDRKTMKISKRFSTSDGLCNNSVIGIVEDRGYLWLSTFSGLSKFDIKKQTFVNFFQDDGLQSNQFLDNASLRLRSGELVFGGIKGFNIFHPDSIKPSGKTPRLLVTQMRINNSAVAADDRRVKKTLNGEIEMVQVSFDEAAITIEFSAPEYRVPGKILYRYFMEGWDKNWSQPTKIRSATYTNITDGNYRLHIQSTDTDGNWVANEKVIDIKVLPPWYRSWWAYGAYLTIVTLGVYAFHRYQKRQSFLQYQVELANLRVDQEKELSENKLSLFTSISHEFRTPLTLIINPIKEFLSNKDASVDPNELVVVYRNANRLLTLVDQLLSFRKTEAQTLRISRFNFVLFVNDIVACFDQQAKSKHIDFTLNCPAEEIEVYVDTEKIEIVLFNIIANAFKFTPPGGSIRVEVTAGTNELEVHITDTGTGIPEETGARIFDMFYQRGDRHSGGGFGIGLSLVKKLIEAHHGTVSYTSTLGIGTNFKLTLLLGNTHLQGLDLTNEGYLPKVQDVPFSTTADGLLGTSEEIYPDQYAKNLVSQGSTTDKKVVLIVEDDHDIRAYIRKILETDYLVYEAENGTAGLSFAEELVPDIVITDVIMDGGNGMDLCANIKSSPDLSHIPVIILTSGSASETRLKGIELGADDFITKPFDKDILLARVANLLKSRNVLQQYFLNEITLKSVDFKVSSEDKYFLERCIVITEKHLDDTEFSVKTIADEMAISTSLLYKKTKAISGKSTNEFIRYIRLRAAARMLINTDKNINETALACGFNDVRYFREQFHKVFGMRPSDYVKKYRRQLSAKHRIVKDF